MEAQRPRVLPEPVSVQTQRLPAFPKVPTGPVQASELTPSLDESPKNAMDIDSILSPESRPQRASSVASGMSLEDLQAAETLEFLKNGTASPQSQVAPPQWVGSQSEFPSDQQEPLLHLLTSQVPLLSSAVSNGIYAYSRTKSYSPVIRYPVEFLERNIGTPVAGTISNVGRRTGVEGGLRWALQGSGKKRRMANEPPSPTAKDAMDVESGTSVAPGRDRSGSRASETLPPYEEGDRSPPYTAAAGDTTAQQVVLRNHQSEPQGWQTRLIVSTSGLSVAMSEQSRKNLKYCLSWLKWANERLAGVIAAITSTLKEWEERSGTEGTPNEAAISARIRALSQDVADTVKRAVAEVSNYAGGALPNNARELVHRYFNSLPLRWQYASTMADTNAEKQADETVSSGKRVLALAHEGLTMMRQVTVVVNDTLVSAENWCDRLGRRQDSRQLVESDVKMDDAPLAEPPNEKAVLAPSERM